MAFFNYEFKITNKRGLPISQIKIACGIECCEIYRLGCINADGSYHLGEPGWLWEGLDCTPPGSGGAAHNGIVPASCSEISECEYRCGYCDESN
ncbi:MAG: hypothetical protein IPP37_12910 [Saprospiraceae bacterium]|nr:hypothetical protein [Saprospiraceae bacterium]